MSDEKKKPEDEKPEDEKPEDEKPEDEKEPTLFDAVSDAVDAETIEPEGADDDAPDKKPVETPAKAGDDSEQEDGEAEDTGKPAAAGEQTVDTPEAKSSSEEAGGEKVTPDPLNDPIPDGLKESTKTRITTLIDRTKATEGAAGERDELVGMVTDTGADAEQFGATLGWLTLYNSPRLEDRRQALQIMTQAVNGLAKEIGEPEIGGNILDGHADLIAEVEEATLTQARAEEIATGRNRKVADDQAAESTRTTSEQQQLADAAVTRGRSALNTLEVTLKGDSDYLAKKAILIPALQLLFRSVHPNQWAGAFQKAYDNLKLPETAVVPTPTPKEETPEPLRPKAPAGQGKKAPTTMAEAIDQSLGEFEED